MSISRFCKLCGKEFETSAYLVKQGYGKYCSRKCTGTDTARRGKDNQRWKGGKTPLTCSQCGMKFEIHPCWIRKGQGKFCSRKCKDNSQKGNSVNSGVRRRIVKTKICEQCKIEFEIHRKRSRFCSRQCANTAHGKNLTGKNNIFWKGGISNSPYDEKFTYSFKRMIRRRDQHVCAGCEKYGNDVHHIDFDKHNSTPKNCIVLCKKCHAQAGIHIDVWKTKLAAIVATREI